MSVVRNLPVSGVTGVDVLRAREVPVRIRQSGNLVPVAGPATDAWRVVDVWELPEVMGAVFEFVTPRVADAGDPTWEDAAWQ
jgi:hypothetical protein